MMSDTKDSLSALSLGEKRELLARLLQQKARARKSYRLSFAQERLWFLHKMDPQSASYNCPQAVRLTGQLNFAALEKALSEIVRRHAILRTTFELKDGVPVQVILPARAMILPLVDLSELPRETREAELERLAGEDARGPFDLAAAPALRATVLRLDGRSHAGLFNMHHIVCDGWSMGIFVRELMALYEAFSEGGSSPLPELQIQYAHYSQWQRESLQGEALEQLLSYWRKHLDGAPQDMELPADKPRPPMQMFHGAAQSLSLPSDLTAGIKDLARQQGATLFITLLAAFNVLLNRYTGQRDILVGAPVSGRNRADIEGLIGFFVNTLALRTHVSGDASFRDLLSSVRQTTLGGLTHQDLPFEKLVDELRPERSLDRTPLVQVMFTVENLPKQTLSLKALTLSPITNETATEKFDLTLSAVEKADRLLVELRYNTDLFRERTIRRMLGHFETLLGAAVGNPDCPLAGLSLLSEAERSQLLNDWNNTATYYPRDKCVHELFEAQAVRTPNEVAVAFEDERLTYRELNARANQLANYLRARGVGPEALVGICMERSLEMIVGLLGILKAGGAYVPLDPAYPLERLAFMLEDTLAGVVITQERLLDSLPSHRGEVVCVDTEWEKIARHSEVGVSREAAEENIAYVIYTSGSTGKPKGVMVQHSSLVNHVYAAGVKYEFKPGDRVLQFASISFDTSAEEIFTTLTRGAALVLRTDSMLASAPFFLQKCRDWNVNVLSLPTAYWHDLTARLTQEDWASVPRLRLVIIGGEKAIVDRFKAWRLRVRDRVRLVNAYSPTEATIGAVMWEAPTLAATDDSPTDVPIGSPISNVEAYVLDENLRPAPVGVYGELYVGGVAVARGYLRQPGLTAERFIPSPFGNGPGGRIYKTGDVVRYRENGLIEMRGRLDNQVKIRGFRVELGEIESALRQHAGVREAVADIREDARGDKRIAAYIVRSHAPVSGPAASPREDSASAGDGISDAALIKSLRAHLNERLPNYMTPSAIVMIDSLPLTPNGKVNRQALPPPDEIQGGPEESDSAARTAAEQALAVIWAEVLGLKKVGIHENFFQLGGDSILAIQIVARSNEAGYRLSPKDIFQHQTIAELATVAGKAPVVEAQQDRVAGPVPLTPIQHWFFEQNFINPDHWNQSVLLEPQKPLEASLVHRVVEKIVEHHDALRLRFVREGPTWRQVNLRREPSTPFTLIDLSEVRPADLTNRLQLAAAQAQASLSITEGPIVRVAQFDLAGRAGRL
ncbi:MAG TPA: amino acid adenylation domain-containing protein, partial [Blastocatellia bacterium]|nr:amino acid adenylation domain-containing protein [Blastocatellia bacterium]